MYNQLSKPFFQGQIIARFPNKLGQVVRIFCVNGCIFVATNPLTGADADKIAAFPAEVFATYKAITDTTNVNFLKIEATLTDADIAKLASQAQLESKSLISTGFTSFQVLTDLPLLSSFVENHEAVPIADVLYTVKMVKYIEYLSRSLADNSVSHVGFNEYSAI